MSFLTHQIVDLPIGAMTLVARDGVLSGVYMDGHRRGPTPSRLGRRVARGFETVRRQLEEYFAGDRRAFELETAPEGYAVPATRLVGAVDHPVRRDPHVHRRWPGRSASRRPSGPWPGRTPATP